MKNFTKFLAILTAVLVFGVNASAQISATSTATAVIYSALTISCTQDLDFGVLIPSSTTAGTMAIDATGTATPTNITEHPSSNPVPALFLVVGEPDETYDIAINDEDLPIAISDGGNSMNITAIVSNPAEGVNAGLLNGSGQQIITVGATLAVPQNQLAGNYTNATAITVTINYN